MTSAFIQRVRPRIASPKDEPVLRVEGLTLAYESGAGKLNEVVRDVDLTLRRGEILGVAGESGCGKSTVALAAIGYRSPGLRVLSGQAQFGGADLLRLSAGELRSIWGRRIAFVSQQASLALNPSLTIGTQLADPLRRHLGLRGEALLSKQADLLRMVEMPDPNAVLARYPFQFSGGQQQRLAIAIAMSCGPELLVMDEPTTGLDPTTQDRISALIATLVRQSNIGVIYVSHDLGLLHAIADRIAILYAGQVAEVGRAGAVVAAPLHPYTRGLMRAAPSLSRPGRVAGIAGRPPSSTVHGACAYAPRCDLAIDACSAGDIPLTVRGDHIVRCRRADLVTSAPVARLQPIAVGKEVVLAVKDLVCTHPGARTSTIRGVSLEVCAGETLGIVGESGSGKSTLLRTIAGLLRPDSGTIAFRGKSLASSVGSRPRAARGLLQLVFQNPDSSLNPRQTVGAILSRPIRLFRDAITPAAEATEIAAMLDAVKLPQAVVHRYPSELSGGQKQRIAIARAFAARPALLLCDEVTSALDVSVQASILELLAELAAERGVATIFVSHDLAVVRLLAQRTAVMRHGEIVESGPTGPLFGAPSHDYTRALLAAVHDLPGELPGT